MVVTVNGCSTRVVAPTLIRDRSFTVASVFKSEPTPSPHLMFNPRTSSRDHTFDRPAVVPGFSLSLVTLTGRVKVSFAP